ncbi:MAG TPA: tetratricopeptide repeat protein [Candidatus Acidoferrum sp.]|nr:tetratricopeptide repeat protein [Candidatus Acidoferrum sp.]
MRGKRIIVVSMAALGVAVLTLNAYRNPRATSVGLTRLPLPPAVLLPSDRAATEQTIRFLENRIQRDPEDFIAFNKLASYYLQRVRETGDLTYLKLASHASRASLATLPAERNIGGLTVLAQSEFTSHEFAASRDHARRLTELEPDKSYPQQILGDALLELGEYQKAKEAFWQMEQLGGIQGLTRVATEQRIARLAALHGDTVAALSHMQNATALAQAMPVPPRETVAWCRWQLGELAFSRGDYAAAEQHDRDALTTFPDYYRALASLGRVRAARGDLSAGIEQYERAISLLPDPSFVAALGDLYELTGRDKDAAAQYALVEAIARLSVASGTLYNRQQALFHADHNIKPQAAYANAAKEYAVRKDIYGEDAVAWTALKARKLPEAQAAMKEALRLGTQDAKLFYHAGMIAQAAGDKASARDYLKRALTLSPQFDPLQSSIARKTLASLVEEDQRKADVTNRGE